MTTTMLGKTAFKRYERQVIRLRRDLHRIPELGFREFKTSAYIADFLRSQGIKFRSGIAGTGIVAEIRGKGAGPAVLLRADMDALPMPAEKTGLPFSSTHPGMMHACGHDMHTAMLMTAGAALKSMSDSFAGRVVMVFQPAEEGEGGGRLIVESGAIDFDSVVAAAALHVIGAMRTGTLGWTKGVTYALADEFKVSVKGRGCHGSTPHLGRDPITAAALIISAINTIVSRRVASSDRVVVSFGMVEGGTAFNIVPDLVRIVGTVRTLDPRLRGRVRRWLDGAVRHAAAAAGVSAGFEYHEGYPLLVSDSSVVDAGIAAANEVFGAGNVEESLPSMGGEDFAYFLRKAPGAMFRLGCSRTGRNMPLHNVEFSPDENALILGVEFLCRFALRYLAGMEVVAAPS